MKDEKENTHMVLRCNMTATRGQIQSRNVMGAVAILQFDSYELSAKALPIWGTEKAEISKHTFRTCGYRNQLVTQTYAHDYVGVVG